MVDNSAFAKEFLGEWNDPTKSRKSLGSAIGLPDEEDKIFLTKLVKKWEKQISFTTNGARQAFAEGKYGRTDDAMVNKDSTMTYDFELPPGFFKAVESHYPLMWRDINHYRWFKQFMVNYMIRPNTKRKPKK